jgi:hypothetical protein
MKINVSQPLNSYEGKPLVENEKPILLRSVIINALNYTTKDTKPTTAEEKMGLYELSVKVFNEDEIELSSEQISMIKKNMAEMFSPVITGQACMILEGKELPIIKVPEVPKKVQEDKK